MKDSVDRSLAAAAVEFDFFEAVRLLECAHRQLPRIGRSKSPQQDPVRLGQSPSLAFAPSTVERYTPPSAESPARMQSWFLGLCGPNGPLPFHMTEFVRDRLHTHRDSALARFFDVFHHRLLCLFYRAWADSLKTTDFDRPEDSRFSSYFGSFFGLGLDAARDRDAVPDTVKFFFTGRLSSPNRNPEGLEAILGEDFGVPVELHSFVGQWIDLPPNAVCSLGTNPETGSLGQALVVGGRIWMSQSNFRLRFGPLLFSEFRNLLPSGAMFQRLKHWVLNYSGREFAWDAQLVLKAAEVPGTPLGGAGGCGLLGWTTWLTSRPPVHDADDLVLFGEN
jgi:type VI secretion system protein ImpH